MNTKCTHIGRLNYVTMMRYFLSSNFRITYKVRKKSNMSKSKNVNFWQKYPDRNISERGTHWSNINQQVMVSCFSWATDLTHIALAEVHRHLALIPELAVHGCPHQQVRQAVLVQINCTQWGAKVRAHLEPSRATEQWVRSQTLLQFIALTYDSHWLDVTPLKYLYQHYNLKLPWLPFIYSAWKTLATSLATGSFFKSLLLSKHFRPT